MPTAKVHELRITLAQAGLPHGGGVGYELFDKQAFGTTSFVEQMNYKRALQGELARSIMSLDAVESARVHLATRERSLYKDDDEPPSASVVLTLRGGQRLATQQVRGIIHLVAGSVDGLKPDRVNVIDASGAPLSAGEDGADGSDGDHELERTLARRVREMLERVVGVGHASVVVTAQLDATRTERTEELYDKDKIALRSETRSVDGNGADATSQGVAGAHGNLPGAPAPTGTPAAPAAGHNTGHLSETRNYEVNRVVSHVTSPKIHIARLHLAVLVDGVHEKAGDLKSPIVPRGAEELARLSALARAAAGLDSERGDKLEMHSEPFMAPDAFDAPVAVPWPRAARVAAFSGAGAAALALIAVLFFALRGRKAPTQTLTALPMKVARYEQALDGVTEPPTPAPLELPGAAIRDRVLAATRNDAARAARVLTGWLQEKPAAKAESRRAS